MSKQANQRSIHAWRAPKHGQTAKRKHDPCPGKNAGMSQKRKYPLTSPELAEGSFYGKNLFLPSAIFVSSDTIVQRICL